MLEVEMLEPEEVERAAKIFLRDGFVAVKNVLVGEQLRRTQEAANRVIGEIVDADPERIGNRGHHRYSFGNQMRHLEWCQLTDLPAVLPILSAIWAAKTTFAPVTVATSRCRELRYSRCIRTATNWALSIRWGQTTTRDLPPALICVNFPMIDFTEENGAIRLHPAPIAQARRFRRWKKSRRG